MVKHIILWQLKEDIEDKESVKKGIKENLESLVGTVPGLLTVLARQMLMLCSIVSLTVRSRLKVIRSIRLMLPWQTLM